MVISDNIIFIELHKTGCTHIRQYMLDYLNAKTNLKHNPATPELLNNPNNIFLASIRDPWEWYISLWAFGCDHKGGVHQALVRQSHEGQLRGLGWKKNPFKALAEFYTLTIKKEKDWKRYYMDVEDASAFRRWVKVMQEQKVWEGIKERFRGAHLINPVAGYLTYRYLNLLSHMDPLLESNMPLKTFEELQEYDQKNCYIHHFIQTENLANDFLRVMSLCGVELAEQQKEQILTAKKTNTSSRKRKADYYYDQETADIIADRERFIIEKFNYTHPFH